MTDEARGEGAQQALSRTYGRFDGHVVHVQCCAGGSIQLLYFCPREGVVRRYWVLLFFEMSKRPSRRGAAANRLARACYPPSRRRVAPPPPRSLALPFLLPPPLVFHYGGTEAVVDSTAVFPPHSHLLLEDPCLAAVTCPPSDSLGRAVAAGRERHVSPAGVPPWRPLARRRPRR